MRGDVPGPDTRPPVRFTSLHALLFATTVGLFFILAVTGVYARFFFSVAPSDQAIFLAHMVVGWVFPIPCIAYAWMHVRLVRRMKILESERLSEALGILVAVLVGVAVATGIDMSVRGAQTSRAHWVLVHHAAAYSAIVMLPVHILWALYRRRAAGRASSIPVEDRFLAPAGILTSSLVFIAAVGLHVPASTPVFAVPRSYTHVPDQKGRKQPFFPGHARTVDGRLIPIDHLSQSDRCGECHTEIFREWSSSTHRFSAVNDHYLAQVKLRIHDVPVKPHLGARFCANCHEPIALFAGEIDPKGRGIDFPENRQQGISCLACHKIERLHAGLMGNANIVVSPHISYLYEKNSSGLTAAAGRALIRTKPGIHKGDLMRPLLKKSEFCSACHKFFIDEAVNGRGFFRLQNTFDEWKHSPFAEAGSDRFRRCQDCHMPLVASRDPAAKPYTDGGRTVYKHRSHRFLGSNTARPFLDGDREQLALTEQFLTKGDMMVALELPGRLRPGSTGKLKVTVFNKGVGHRFPTGTVDTHDCWIELVVTDAAGRRVLHSGALDAAGNVDPQSHQFSSRAVDEDGAWLYRRDMWNLAAFERSQTVFPGNFNSRTYDLAVPPDSPGPLEVVARLNFRKYNQAFTRFVFGRGPLREGSGYSGPHSPGVRLPVTVIASDAGRIVLGDG
jgi:hypothetical protein